MTLYANFLPNPSFELATTSWTTDSGSMVRNTAHKQVGAYGLEISATTTHTQTKGVKTTVAIEPGGPYSLSGYLLAHSAQGGSANSRGIKVTVYDLLPGETESARQQVKMFTGSVLINATLTTTTLGRWTLTNLQPRATADRLVITIHTGNTYYQAGSSTVAGPFTRDFPVHHYGNSTSAAYSAAQNFASTKYNATISGPQSLPGSGPGAAGYQVTYYTLTTIPEVSGGYATIWVDALQLTKTSTSVVYVDGTVTGHTWSGTPHNSPTLSMAQTESTALATSTGTLTAHLRLPLQSTATATSTGSLETYLTGVEAEALAASTGTLALWQYGPVSASATATHALTIEVAALIQFEFAGTATSTGTALALIAIPSIAVATATSTGTLELGPPPESEAHAAAISTGTIEVAIAGVMQAHGTAVSVGFLEIGAAIPVCAFDNFALFGVNDNDPLMTTVGLENGATLTGASGSDWVRIFAEFAAPGTLIGANPAWKQAAYAVPGITFTNLPAGSWQEFTRVQLELAQPFGGPTTYMDGGSVRALVYPDRLNLAPADITVVNLTTSAVDDADTTTSPIPGDTAPKYTVYIDEGVDYNVFMPLDRLRPNVAYNISMYVALSPELTDAGFFVRDTTTAEQLAPPSLHRDAEDDDTFEPSENWRRLSSTFIAPSHGTATLVFTWNAEGITGEEFFKVAGILVEEGAGGRPYFFNPADDPEYIYRLGFTDPSGGVFHYQDRERKKYILNRALKDYVPSGIGVIEPEFGVIPHYDI